MNPISDAKFSDDYAKFVLHKQPEIHSVHYQAPEKKFDLEKVDKNQKKKDKQDKDKEDKEEPTEKEDSPWIPKAPRKKQAPEV